MKPNCTELAAQYEHGEITFDQFMNTATRQEPYVVPQTKRRGRRLAQRQGQLVTPAAPEPVVELPNGLKSDDPILGWNVKDHYFRSGEEIHAEITESNRKRAEAQKDYEARTAAAQQAPLTDEEGAYVAAPGNLKTAAAALAFVTAGNAYFTVRSQKTGTRYTYRVSRADCSRCGKKDCTCWAFPTYFVSLLSGPENTSDYTYLGMIRDRVFRLTRASKMNETSGPVRAFRWVYERLVRRELPPQTEIWHEGRCGRCGRMLTVPESVAAGIGPECAGRMGL